MAGAKSPRAASAGCYIDRRTCGSGRPADTPRSSGTDTGVGSAPARWTGTFVVYLANAAVAVSLRL